MLSDGMDQILKMKFWPFCSDFWHTFDSRFFYNVSLWRSLFFGGGQWASCDIAITRFGCHVNWLQSTALLLGEGRSTKVQTVAPEAAALFPIFWKLIFFFKHKIVFLHWNPTKQWHCHGIKQGRAFTDDRRSRCDVQHVWFFFSLMCYDAGPDQVLQTCVSKRGFSQQHQTGWVVWKQVVSGGSRTHDPAVLFSFLGHCEWSQTKADATGWYLCKSVQNRTRTRLRCTVLLHGEKPPERRRRVWSLKQQETELYSTEARRKIY